MLNGYYNTVIMIEIVCMFVIDVKEKYPDAIR